VQRRPRRYVTLEGYAVEGGFDGPYQPSTCFRPTIALGRHEGPGDADQLWRDYEKVLDFIPVLGFDGVRLNVEWARIEPHRGEIDDAALERYAEVVRYAASLGLGVTVVIVDRAWPAWLGLEAWLLPWVAPLMVAQARRVVGALDAVSGVVVFAQPSTLVAGFLGAKTPPWRRTSRVDAGIARSQIASITATLRDDVLVGPKIVESTGFVSVAAEDVDIKAAFKSDCDEVYVRSLLRGHGPTRNFEHGLLRKTGEEWRIQAPAHLLELLR
jgi:beta-glucosidase/6-phospho-beta-glucosidase/beta-galactosidase